MSVVEISVAPPMRSEDWDSFDVPEPYRAEIIQGELVVTPTPARAHVRAQVRLIGLLTPSLPEDAEILTGSEWRLDVRGIVAMAPQPDLMVVAIAKPLTSPPLLAVEVLSPSDNDRLAVTRLTRIEGKHIDYAGNGLADYLEIDLSQGEPLIVRYELRHNELVEVARARGSERLVADRPFPYVLTPNDLVLSD